MAREPSTVGLQPGQRVGKYEIVEHVATGGMGAVYRARDLENRHEVALKVLTEEMAAKPAMIERFRREARSAAKLSHENIVRVFDFGEAAGTMYIAMEFVEGIDLHEHIENKGKLDPEESRIIMIQAARALAHAAGHNIVHRDIKPSNFLLTKKNGRLLVKLTDMGLAREQDTEQFRVTRAGTTVGTVDYISPEQARDSGVADARSDLYSLGCTWFHMLAGQPPFAKGGLAERLVKHMETPPPDIRKLNPRVSDDLVRVLGKLLAKKPDDRYQTAQELVQALQELQPTRKPSSSQRDTVHDSQDGQARQKPRSGTARKKKSKSTTADEPTTRPWPSWGLIAVVAGVLILVGGVVLFLLSNRGNTPTPVEPPLVVGPTPVTPRDVNPGSRDVGPVVKDAGPKDRNPGPVITPVPVPITAKYPTLYKPTTPIPVETLRADFRTPWKENADPPVDAITLRVSRSSDGKPGWHPTLTAALAAAPEGKALIVEIHDNGLRPETPIQLEGKSLTLKAGQGYRPLLVWDLPLTLKEKPVGPHHLISVTRGSLWVENLELAVVWPESQQIRGDSLFSVQDGDLSLRDTTISQSGKADGLVLARVSGMERVRVRLERVHARGEGLAILHADAKNLEVGFDSCLLVGGKGPLLRITSSDQRTAQLLAARSTFIGHRSLLELTAPADQATPHFSASWWDCLLSRMGTEANGELLRLPPSARLQNIHWQGTNCLLAGWPMLQVGGPGSFSASQVRDWMLQWNRTEGEVVQGNPWPSPAVSEVENKPATTYRTLDTPLCFAASGDPERPLGAPLDRLPASRDAWQALLVDKYPVPPVVFLDGSAPPIPSPGDGLYHGEMLDLTTAAIDIGQHLSKQKKLGPRVVLHLRGSGEKLTAPIRVPSGTTLVLHAEPPTGTEAPLILRFSATAGAEPPPLIATDKGSLEISNLELRPPEGTFARCPAYLVQTRGGSLSLYRCKLQTPPTGLAGLKGLLSIEGSGQAEAEKSHRCTLTECVLSTGGQVLRVSGNGIHVGLQGSLLLAGGPLLEFDLPQKVGARLGVSCTLENCTLVARGPALVVGPTAPTELIQEPLVIQSRDCLLLHPFDSGSNPALLLARGNTLSSGVILWQSDSDVLDARISRLIVNGEDKPGALTATPARIWGSASQRKVLTVPGLKGVLDARSWAALEPLLLPNRIPGLGDRTPGANLPGIGAIKKKS